MHTRTLCLCWKVLSSAWVETTLLKVGKKWGPVEKKLELSLRYVKKEFKKPHWSLFWLLVIKWPNKSTFKLQLYKVIRKSFFFLFSERKYFLFKLLQFWNVTKDFEGNVSQIEFFLFSISLLFSITHTQAQGERKKEREREREREREGEMNRAHLWKLSRTRYNLFLFPEFCFVWTENWVNWIFGSHNITKPILTLSLFQLRLLVRLTTTL